MSHPPYLIDANVMIEPKNRFYPFDLCPGFWDFLEREIKAGAVTSVVHVREEIRAGEDELKEWISSLFKRSDFADCEADEKVVQKYNEVSLWVMENYAVNVANDFLKPGVADPWLVSYAAVHGGCVVTQETPKPSGRKASLVDVCDRFGVHHVNVFEFLRAEKARFVLDGEAGEAA